MSLLTALWRLSVMLLFRSLFAVSLVSESSQRSNWFLTVFVGEFLDSLPMVDLIFDAFIIILLVMLQ